jgi:hypothetical protein
VIAGTAQATANAVNRRAQNRAAPAPAPVAASPPPPPAAFPHPTTVPAGGEVDLVTALSRLAQLRDGGVLTEAEFEIAKSRMLA